ncbi:MAG TPA: FAD-binding oxidoreductase [Gemmatimonadota bacterium]|nr:FAD-binding oxidoreductase [Gemmatimonadota bacterium]
MAEQGRNGGNPAIEMAFLDGGTTKLAPEALAAFRAAFRGPVLEPGDPGYDEARQVWNAMIDRRPGLIARATGTADVVAAVRFAREHGLLSSVKGGGHNIAGLAVCDGGLVIDCSLMKGVWVDPHERIARAQAGCTLGDVDRETQLHGLAAVLGFISATGIAGLTTGGGFGYLTRSRGWTCDNVVSMEVVTADGRVVRASAEEDSDLFWCLRGGSGNFGIVTSFEYELFPVGPEIVGGAVVWKAADAPQVLEFYREFTASAPRDLTSVAVLRIAPPAPWLPKEIHGQPIIAVFGCHSGDPAEAERAVAPLKAFGAPVADILVRRPYVQMQSILDATQPKGRRYYWKSEYLPGLEDGLLQGVVEHAGRVPSPFGAVILFQIDGALNDLADDHSPAGNRDAAYVLNVTASWEDAAADRENRAWARTAWEALKGYGTGGAYINFMTEDEGADRTRAAYGDATLSRLADLKRRYDPGNLFRHTKGF